MMAVGGIMGAYTFLVRGGVFCNAQTANLLMMGVSFGQGDWTQGLYYLIPAAAYLSGTIVSELLQLPDRPFCSVKWTTIFTFIELISLAAIGFLPLSLPNQIIQVLVNFLASMQYNSFRKAEGVPVATTFCTNHVRQIGIWMVHYFKNHEDSSITRMAIHMEMLACFIGGAALSALLAPVLSIHMIWLALLPLSIAFSSLLMEDLDSLHYSLPLFFRREKQQENSLIND